MTPEGFLRAVVRFRIHLSPPARAATETNPRKRRKQLRKLGGSAQWCAIICVSEYSQNYDNRKRFFGWGNTPEEAVQQVIKSYLDPNDPGWGLKGKRVISLDFGQG